MNGVLVAAAAVSLATFGLHVFAGGPAVARPLLAARDIKPVPKLTNYYCWHLVSMVLAAMTIAFARAAFAPESHDLAILMTALAGGFTLWSLGLVAWKQQRLLHMPQWCLFLPITVLGALGVA